MSQFFVQTIETEPVVVSAVKHECVQNAKAIQTPSMYVSTENQLETQTMHVPMYKVNDISIINNDNTCMMPWPHSILIPYQL